MRGFIVVCVYVGGAALNAQVSAPVAAPVAPYSIEFEHRKEQTLADGTHIVQLSRQRQYRDSAGRTRREFDLPAELPAARHTSVAVTDTVSHRMLTWTMGNRTDSFYWANDMVLPHVPSPPHQPVAPDATIVQSRPKRTQEDLGRQFVQGVACRATRVTLVYPINAFGNDRPVTVVQESCVSHELVVTLRSQTSDPRTGVSTLTAASINLVEPDASLFQPPPGFTERKTVGAVPTVTQ